MNGLSLEINSLQIREMLPLERYDSWIRKLPKIDDYFFMPIRVKRARLILMDLRRIESLYDYSLLGGFLFHHFLKHIQI